MELFSCTSTNHQFAEQPPQHLSLLRVSSLTPTQVSSTWGSFSLWGSHLLAFQQTSCLFHEITCKPLGFCPECYQVSSQSSSFACQFILSAILPQQQAILKVFPNSKHYESLQPKSDGMILQGIIICFNRFSFAFISFLISTKVFHTSTNRFSPSISTGTCSLTILVTDCEQESALRVFCSPVSISAIPRDSATFKNSYRKKKSKTLASTLWMHKCWNTDLFSYNQIRTTEVLIWQSSITAPWSTQTPMLSAGFHINRTWPSFEGE